MSELGNLEKKETDLEKKEVKVEGEVKKESLLTYAALILSAVAIIIAVVALLSPPKTVTVYRNITVTTTIPSNTVTLKGYNISSQLITPPLSLSDAPVVTAQQPFGSRLTNINAPFNSTELAIVNNAPNAYFETAGEMFLNHTLNNTVGASVTKVPLFVVNGKPTVVYYGSITCLWCGENRWSMMLALSRFGNFSNIFKGYSALQDYDVPTMYWSPAHYTSGNTPDFGSFYSSKYINFIAIEDVAPISGGFRLTNPTILQQKINQTGNLAYKDTFSYLVELNAFQGTPFTVWGAYSVTGADAVAFGNSPPSGNKLPLTNMTHEQMLQQLANPSSQLAWTEYAGADYYTAMICKTLNNSAPVCNLAAIKAIEPALG